jgi:sugar phosphate isomerase/epimerase
MSAAAAADRLGLYTGALPGWELPRLLGAAVALAVPAIDWAVGPADAVARPAYGAALRERCERAGLRCGGVLVQDPAVTLAAPRRAAAWAAFAGTLGAEYVRLFAPRYAGGSLAAGLRRAADGLDRVIERAGAAGVTVLIETAPGTLAPSPELAAALVERHPPKRAAVLYDPGNMVIEGHLAPALAIARLGRHLGHVHVKNIAWMRRDGAWRWRHAGLTDGMLDWGEIVAALAAAGYRGRYSIDHLGGRATPALLHRECEHLRELLARSAS